MKFKLFLDKNKDEEVQVYAHERTELINQIEKLVDGSNLELVGTREDEKIKLDLASVTCFFSENNKTYAVVDNVKYQVKLRLYQVESLNDSRYLKLNQSCIGNINKIERFKVSIGGALLVQFIDGYEDYVARREVKNVKQRMGL